MTSSLQTASVEAVGDGRARASGRTTAHAASAALRRIFWDRHSIRTRLLSIVILIEIAAALVGGGVMVLNARSTTRTEIDASYALAELLVEQTVRLARDDTPTQEVLAHLPLQLRFLRHVRITVRDADDVPIEHGAEAEARSGGPASARAPAPGWFYALIAPPLESRVVPVVAKDRRIGSVLIVSAPADEIAEAWERAVALAWVALPVNVAVVGALYLLFGRALAPLTGLTRGLLDLERRNYRVRLPAPAAREFVALTDRFNALAEALAAARAENVGLWNRLISAQDDERRRTALELHDEVGPTLFGLKANATSVANALGNGTEPARGAALERLHEMLAIIERLQVINRSLLNRLRPMALGHIPLQELVAQMVRDRGREHPAIAFLFAAHDLARSYGDSIDLTIYRCVQESLTNAIRHANPSIVSVTVGERAADEAADASGQIEVCVTDDGRGIEKDAPLGFGLQGMRERVQAVGGEFVVGSAATGGAGGTSVRVAIPIPSRLSPGADDAHKAGDAA